MSQINSVSSANIFSQIAFMGAHGGIEPSICTPELPLTDCRIQEASTPNFFENVSKNIADLESLSADNFSSVDVVFFRILADDIILLEENIHPSVAVKKAEVNFLANRLVKLYQRKTSGVARPPSEVSQVPNQQVSPPSQNLPPPTSQTELYSNNLKNREFSDAENYRFDFETPLFDRETDFSKSKMRCSASEKPDSSGYSGIQPSSSLQNQQTDSPLLETIPFEDRQQHQFETNEEPASAHKVEVNTGFQNADSPDMAFEGTQKMFTPPLYEHLQEPEALSSSDQSTPPPSPSITADNHNQSLAAVDIEKVPADWRLFLRRNRRYKASKFTELLRLKTKKIETIIKNKGLLSEINRLTVIWGVKEILLKRPIWKLKATRTSHEKSLFDSKEGLMQKLSTFEKFKLIRRCVHFLKGTYQKATINKILDSYWSPKPEKTDSSGCLGITQEECPDDLTEKERQVISACYKQESSLFIAAGFENETKLINRTI